VKTEPQKEHQWLQKLVGEWTFEMACDSPNPGDPPMKLGGTETVRSLGGLWVVCEGQGEVPGSGVSNTLLTIGYDPQKKRYIGTWIGSMMTQLWVYDGAVDPGGNALSLDTEGPDWSAEGKTAKYRETIEFKGDDQRTFTSRVLTPDGAWKTLMTANYRRNR
jgi:hypothetical protein